MSSGFKLKDTSCSVSWDCSANVSLKRKNLPQCRSSVPSERDKMTLRVHKNFVNDQVFVWDGIQYKTVQVEKKVT